MGKNLDLDDGAGWAGPAAERELAALRRELESWQTRALAAEAARLETLCGIVKELQIIRRELAGMRNKGPAVLGGEL